ncbi:MAG: hypothetical protein ABH830_03945 [Patescibacteria group bacterium]
MNREKFNFNPENILPNKDEKSRWENKKFKKADKVVNEVSKRFEGYFS